jgi:hypothetical protein
LIASWWASPVGSASEVDVILASNEGWYLTYPEFGLRKFEQHSMRSSTTSALPWGGPSSDDRLVRGLRIVPPRIARPDSQMADQTPPEGWLARQGRMA